MLAERTPSPLISCPVGATSALEWVPIRGKIVRSGLPVRAVNRRFGGGLQICGNPPGSRIFLQVSLRLHLFARPSPLLPNMAAVTVAAVEEAPTAVVVAAASTVVAVAIAVAASMGELPRMVAPAAVLTAVPDATDQWAVPHRLAVPARAERGPSRAEAPVGAWAHLEARALLTGTGTHSQVPAQQVL